MGSELFLELFAPVIAVAGLLFGLQWRRVRLEREQTKEFLSLMQQRYHS